MGRRVAAGHGAERGEAGDGAFPGGIAGASPGHLWIECF